MSKRFSIYHSFVIFSGYSMQLTNGNDCGLREKTGIMLKGNVGRGIMKKVMILVISLALATINFGCSSKNNPQLMMKPVKANAVDADKNGVIEDKDVFVLYDLSDQIYADKIVPYMDKAGIINEAELMSQDANFQFRSKLTVMEYEVFIKNIEEWNKVKAQIDATAKESMDQVVKKEKLVSRTAKVAGCHVWGGVELSNGIVIKYAGIMMPVGGTNNKYSRFVALFSSKLITGRLIRYELTGNKVGNIGEAYIYINDVCINEELLRRGYALAVRDKSEMSEKFVKLEDKAKESKIGLWAFYPQDNPFAKPLY